MIERRIKVAKELLKPEASCLIVSIDEKEFLRLGMLLEQVFPESEVVMITSVISAKGAVRPGRFSRVEEHIFFVFLGEAKVKWWTSNMLPSGGEEDMRGSNKELAPIEWLLLRRREPTSVRSARPNQFYPVFVRISDGHIHSIGDPIPPEIDRNTVPIPDGTLAIWPLKPDGTEMLWGLTPEVLRKNWAEGYVRINNWKPKKLTGSVQYLQTGVIKRIKSGDIVITGHALDGSVQGHIAEGANLGTSPKRVWNMRSHNAETGGTNMLTTLIPGRRFPFPKSLYAVQGNRSWLRHVGLRSFDLDLEQQAGRESILCSPYVPAKRRAHANCDSPVAVQTLDKSRHETPPHQMQKLYHDPPKKGEFSHTLRTKRTSRERQLPVWDITIIRVCALWHLSRAPRNGLPSMVTTSPSRSRADTAASTCAKATSSALGSIIRNTTENVSRDGWRA